MKPLLALGIIGLLFGGAYYWLSIPTPDVPAVHVAVLLDISDSLSIDVEHRVVRELLFGGLLAPGAHRGSRFFVTLTGGPATSMEPVSVATLDIPFSNRVMEGKGAIEKKRRELLVKLLDEYSAIAIEPKCSPIFLAVKRALEQLHAAGCGEKSDCRLFIRSDGEETEESWLRESILRQRIPKDGPPVSLDNRGIKVRWCGFAETRGVLVEKKKKRSLTPERNAARSDFILSTWRSLFSEPDNVVFEPFCPSSKEPAKGAL